MRFEFYFFLTKKFHLNTLKSLKNFKIPQLKIFSIIVDFRIKYQVQ